MLKRNTVWFVGLLLSLMASHTLGLGLGSVAVESYLNQPLRLRIEILQLGETRIEDVTVQMASTDDFARFVSSGSEFCRVCGFVLKNRLMALMFF